MTFAETPEASPAPSAPAAAPVRLPRTEMYGIDFTELKKGDYLEPERLEAAVGVTRELASYSLKVAGLVSAIKRARPELQVRQHQSGLSICTDNEAVEYGLRQQASALKTLVRASVEAETRVDSSKLSDHHRRVHEAQSRAGAGFRLQQAAERKKALGFIKMLPKGGQRPSGR